MSGSRWGRVAHVFVAIGVALPVVAGYAAIGVAVALPDQSVLNRGLLIALAVGFTVVVVAVALLPVVRPAEVALARMLLGVELPDVVDSDDWGSRGRGAAWLAVLAGIGVVVAAALLYLVPTGVGLVAFPFGGESEVQWPGGTASWRVGSGAAAAWLSLVGLVALGAAVTVVLVAGHLLTRLAGRLLGPTLAERVALAGARERSLARANALARDVHDGIGHTITAMTLQATAARRLLATDPAAAERAMLAVEELGRRAQADVDGVVGALRGDAAEAVDDDEDLVEAVAHLVSDQPGPVRLDAPDRISVPAGHVRTAYRIVQEGLTNAARHGRPPVSVSLRQDAAGLRVEVRNGLGPGAATPTAGRRGLVGLRERVLLLGGELSAGADGEHWVLSAELPLPEGES